MQWTRALQSLLFAVMALVWVQVLFRGVTAYTFAEGLAKTTLIVALALVIEGIRRVVL